MSSGITYKSLMKIIWKLYWTLSDSSVDLSFFLGLGFWSQKGAHHLGFSSLASMVSGVARQPRAAEVSHIDPLWMYGTKNSAVKDNFSASSP